MATEYTNFDKLKEKLTELGLYELGMNIKDMVDLMAAIRNSCDSAQQEELLRESKKTSQSESCTTDTKVEEVKRGMERRYKNAPERRLPWNLFPIPEQLTTEQRVHVMAAYKEQLSICRYRRAKTSSVFADWNCVFSIPILKHRLPPEFKSGVHHTRSGRTVKAAPHYVDDDDSDTETSVSRKCRKKLRKLTNDEIIAKSSLFHDTPILSQSNFDLLIEIDKRNVEAKNAEKQVSNSTEKMHLDISTSGDGGDGNQSDHKRWSSPSPEVSGSQMMVVAQVHRDCQNIENIQIIDDDIDQEEKRMASNTISRKRPKRLKISVDE